MSNTLLATAVATLVPTLVKALPNDAFDFQRRSGNYTGGDNTVAAICGGTLLGLSVLACIGCAYGKKICAFFTCSKQSETAVQPLEQELVIRDEV